MVRISAIIDLFVSHFKSYRNPGCKYASNREEEWNSNPSTSGVVQSLAMECSTNTPNLSTERN